LHLLPAAVLALHLGCFFFAFLRAIHFKNYLICLKGCGRFRKNGYIFLFFYIFFLDF